MCLVYCCLKRAIQCGSTFLGHRLVIALYPISIFYCFIYIFCQELKWKFIYYSLLTRWLTPPNLELIQFIRTIANAILFFLFAPIFIWSKILINLCEWRVVNAHPATIDGNRRVMDQWSGNMSNNTECIVRHTRQDTCWWHTMKSGRN